ncbi:MAG: phosphotransferase [Alphaproteobacteria bacterium]|nr:phosphotransferase [Alphaproteobacteria bacterium]
MHDIERRIRGLNLWQGEITLTPLKGGVSNASFTVEHKSEKFVVRLGEDYPFHQVSRAREAIASKAAFKSGLAPEVVHIEQGLMVLRHIEASTFSEADVRLNAERCLDMIIRCHRDMAGLITGQGAIFWVFQILRDYGQTLQAKNHARAHEVPRWMAITNSLEKQQVPLPIIFGHHDLLPTNFIDDGKRLWLIDWEYGAYGTAMFDLANLAAANSFAADEETRMLEQYFGAPPNEALVRSFSAMKVAAALREALWGMISELYLNAPGADYVAYAAEYLGRFENIFQSHQTRFPTQ